MNMTFDEWWEDNGCFCTCGNRDTTMSAWAESAKVEREAIIAELLEIGASEDGEFIAMIRDRFVMRK